MLKSYINLNTELRKNAKNEFEKDFFKSMNNSVFGKTMENIRNHRDIKLVTSDKRRKRLVSEPNYHSHKKFSDHLMAIEMKKTRVKMTKPLYLGMSILDISKILMYEFWYDYIKPKYGDRAKLCYTDTDSFIIYIKTKDFFEDISNDVERWFDTSNYDENDRRPLPINMNKRLPGLFKDVTPRAKTYAYLKDVDDDDDDDDEKNKIINKKAKGTKKFVIKCRLTFENYKDCLFNDKTIQRSQQRFKSYHHKMNTEEVNKIILSSDDDKRLETSDRVTTYPYGTNEFKLCEDEMLNVCKAKETFKILSKDCENDLYVISNIFLNYMKTKCAREMKKYVKCASKNYKV